MGYGFPGINFIEEVEGIEVILVEVDGEEGLGLEIWAKGEEGGDVNDADGVKGGIVGIFGISVIGGGLDNGIWEAPEFKEVSADFVVGGAEGIAFEIEEVEGGVLGNFFDNNFVFIREIGAEDDDTDFMEEAAHESEFDFSWVKGFSEGNFSCG